MMSRWVERPPILWTRLERKRKCSNKKKRTWTATTTTTKRIPISFLRGENPGWDEATNVLLVFFFTGRGSRISRLDPFLEPWKSRFPWMHPKQNELSKTPVGTRIEFYCASLHVGHQFWNLMEILVTPNFWIPARFITTRYNSVKSTRNLWDSFVSRYYQVLPGFTGFFYKDLSGFDRVLPSFTEFRFITIITFIKTRYNSVKSKRNLWDFTFWTFYRVLPGFYQISNL